MMDMGGETTSMTKIIQDNQQLELTNKSQATSMNEMRNSVAALSITCKFCGQPVSAFDLSEHWKPHLFSDSTMVMDADTISIVEHIRSFTELEAAVKDQTIIVKSTNDFIVANAALGQLDEVTAMMKIIRDNQQLDLTNKSQATSLIEMRNWLASLSTTCKFCRHDVSAFDISEHWQPHLDSNPTLVMDADMISLLEHIRSFTELEAAVKNQAVIVKATNDFIAAKKVKCKTCDADMYATGIASHLDDHAAEASEAADNAALGQLGDTDVDEYVDNLIATPTSIEQQISIAEHHEAYHETVFANLFDDQNTLGACLHEQDLLPGPTAANSVAQPFQPFAAEITHDAPQQFKNEVWFDIDDSTGDLFVAGPMVTAQHHPVPPGVVAAAAADGQPHAYLPEPMVAAPHHPVPPGVVAAAAAAAAAEGQPHAYLPELAAPRVLAAAAVGQPVEDDQQSA